MLRLSEESISLRLRERIRGIILFRVSAAIVVIATVSLNFLGATTNAYLHSHNPPWSPTYNVTESLITMQCNSSGFSNVGRATQFGIVSYDWSNAKEEWAKSKPMDCEEKLSEQARKLANSRGDGGNTHIFVYRNVVKALPWFSTVREKLVDPAYNGFFLDFNKDPQTPLHVPRCAAESPTKCSDLYHDQEQTPQVPTPQHLHPDGACSKTCDCGQDLPCGEYYFDHRNGTMLREWLTEEVIMGALIDDHEGLIVDGLFLDDYWCSDQLCHETNNSIKGCPCDDPFQGPTESERHAVLDMGLSDQEILEITREWNLTMSLIEKRLLEHGAYTWWLIENQENANAMPYILDFSEQHSTDSSLRRNNLSDNSERCMQVLEDACRTDSSWQTKPRLFGFSVNETSHHEGHWYLPNFDLEWAFFLLVRGPYSWAGWGVWGMTWPFQKEPSHGALPPLPHGVPLPDILTPEKQIDYGAPLGTCYQPSSQEGVFRREWSNNWIIEIDCNGCRHENDKDETEDSSCHRSGGIKHRIEKVAPPLGLREEEKIERQVS